MKTFTFYGQRKYEAWEECSFSVEADSEEQARQIFLNAIEEDETDQYFNDDWESLDDTYEGSDERIDYLSENFDLIYDGHKLLKEEK